MLGDPFTSLNVYWSILKMFLNNKKFFAYFPFLRDFEEKAKVFNASFYETKHIIE